MFRQSAWHLSRSIYFAHGQKVYRPTSLRVRAPEASDVAQAVLEGRTTVLEAVRDLVSLAYTDAIADVEDRRLIIGIGSETDHLPVGEVRKEWAPYALKMKDVEIARCEELYRPRFLETCKRIAARLRQ